MKMSELIQRAEERILHLPSWGVPLLLSLVTFAVYANSFPGVFILDDIHIVFNNVLVREFDVVAIFRSDYWHGIENSGLYRPLTILSLAINRVLTGDGAWGYHLVNVLLQALACCLFWWVLVSWEFSRSLALLAALLFAVHPIHGEVVNVVVGRSELLVAVFLFVGFLSACHVGWHAAVFTGLAFAAALLSKESAMAFLVMLPVADACVAGSIRVWRARWRIYTILLLVALIWLWWRSYGVVSDLPRFVLSQAAAPLAHVDPLTRILTALQHQFLYLKILYVPIPLQSVYSTADLPSFITTPWSFAGVLVIIATGALLSLVVIGVRRRFAAATFALLYMLSFAITSNVLFPIGVTMAERLAYFPSVWFCAGVAALVMELSGRVRSSQIAVGCVFVYLLFLAGVCINRNRDYVDEPSLWTAEIRQNPQDFLGWQSVAESLANNYRDFEAEAAYRTMLRLAPNYPGGLRSWTFFLLLRERPDEAYENARKAQLISRSRNEQVAVAFDSLDVAEALLGLGRNEEGLAELEDGSIILDRVSRLHELRARLLNALGRDAEAVQEFNRVERIPSNSNLYLKLAISLFRLDRLDEAREKLEKDLAVRGDKAETLNLLGAVAARQKKWSEALAAFSRAVQLEPGNSYYQENLEQARINARES